eukprot:c9083_g1_i3.p1 GENE.c9083_g1_i3~~c9083_g1_i3.p1  ORF type:complete len:431 (+),score=105.84 c9083_g1_i3:62-1354(+)
MSQAKSIKCQNCGIVFLSVEEVQLHADQTGHDKFEESAEIPIVHRCDTCGKPCRSLEERDIHQKRTGHAMFTQSTLEKDINVTKDFKELTDRNLNAVKDEIESVTGKHVKVKEHKVEEMVPPFIDEERLKELCDMGFSVNRSTRALFYTNQQDVAAAVEWLSLHADDMDVDEPLLVPTSEAGPKKELTAEEKSALIESLRQKNKDKRERDDKEEMLKRERERINAGKQIAEAKRTADELQLKRDIEARKREKLEDEKAKARMREVLRQEREDRLRAAGKWTPEAAEELQKQFHPDKPKHTETASSQPLPSVVTKSLQNKLHEAVVHVKKNNEDAIFKTAVSTLQTYITNIHQNPNEEKFRKIKISNKAYLSRVAPANGGARVLELAGFELQHLDDGDALVLPRDRVDPELLAAAAKFCHDSLNNPFFGAF